MNNENTPQPEPDLPPNVSIDVGLRLVENRALDVLAGFELARRRAAAAGEMSVEQVREIIADCDQWLDKLERIAKQVGMDPQSGLRREIEKAFYVCRLKFAAVLPDENGHGQN